MSRTFTKTWCSALLGAIVFYAGFTHGGEVTVIGSRWTGQSSYSATNLSPEQSDSMSGDQTESPNSNAGQVTVESGTPGAIPDQSLPYGVEPPGTATSTKDAPLKGLFGPWFRWEGSPYRAWTIDYRCRSLTSGNTSFEYGTPDLPPVGWTPLNRSDFALNSLWHGLRVGVEQPNWGAQFEWMMPQQGIQGDFSDYDWNPPNPDGSYTDLGFMKERWSGGWGQMIDLGMQFRLLDKIYKAPIEVWPIAGFRWQRLEITCRDLVQVKSQNTWYDPPLTTSGDIFRFNQQYYTGYLGGQLRTHVGAAIVTVQGDWGATWAYNTSHYLDPTPHRSTMDSTQGDSWHISVMTEIPLNEQISLGFQYDHLAISTLGSHHLLNLPAGQDLSWTNGVAVCSNQNWITGFVRFRF
jgi:hypothetical protein